MREPNRTQQPDQHLLRQPSVGLCVSRELTIEYCNDRFADLFEYPTPKQLFGRPVAEVIAPSDRARLEPQLQELASLDREALSTAATGLTRDDDRVPIDLVVESVQVGDTTVLVASVFERTTGPSAGSWTGDHDGNHQHDDPTAALVADLVHDLRNPLTVATGHLALLRQETALSDAGEKRLERVTLALTRMETLIDEALEIAQPGESLARRPVAIADLAEQAWQTVPTENATLTLDSSRTASADPSRLIRVFENLFRNAVEHGSSDVRIEVGDLAARPGFYVADDGPGIPSADRDRVSEPGYTTHEAGTGLGLAIVSRIVDAHGWQIDLAESTAGGTRVEIHTGPGGS